VQIPGYLEKVDDLKAAGVDEVIVFCVNDAAVMGAWAADQNVPENSLLTFMGDPSSDLTLELDIELKHPGPYSKGLFRRAKRTAMYIENGIFKAIRVAEGGNGVEDPAGDDFPEVTLADAMLKVIADVKAGHASEL